MRSLLATVSAVLLCASPSAEQDRNWKKAFEEKLKEVYVPSKVAMMDPGRVNTLGTVLSIQKTGIGADRSDTTMYQRARIIDGELKGTNQGSREGTYVLPAGTKVYIRTVSASDETIDFHIYTLEPIERLVAGTTRSDRYTAMIRYEFPKGYLATADFDEVKKVIGAVLATDDQSSASRTIELGQSPEQVEKILGKPENIIKLGEKTTYVYKNMKVTFMNGKVSDVQ